MRMRFFSQFCLGKIKKGSNEIVVSAGSNENQSLILLNFLRSQSPKVSFKFEILNAMQFSKNKSPELFQNCTLAGWGI